MTTIKELNEFTKKLVDAGYGDYTISQGYDCNYAIVDICIDYPHIRHDEIILAEGNGYNSFDSDSIKKFGVL